jgi:hypothetical protein
MNQRFRSSCVKHCTGLLHTATASLWHLISYSVIPSTSVILREQSDRRISLRAGSAKNLVFEKLGIMGIDALHIACAEKANNPSLSLALKDLIIQPGKSKYSNFGFKII